MCYTSDIPCIILHWMRANDTFVSVACSLFDGWRRRQQSLQRRLQLMRRGGQLSKLHLYMIRRTSIEAWSKQLSETQIEIDSKSALEEFKYQHVLSCTSTQHMYKKFRTASMHQHPFQNKCPNKSQCDSTTFCSCTS